MIGEEIMFPQARQAIFPSQLISIFLSNAFDLLQSLSMLELITAKVVKHEFQPSNKLLLATQRYDLWEGNAHIGGIFLRYFLLSRHDFMSLYDNIKHTLEMHKFSYIQNALDIHRREIGQELVTLVKKKSNALLILLNVKPPEVNPPLRPVVPDLNVSLEPMLLQDSIEAVGSAQIPPIINRGMVQEHQDEHIQPMEG